MKVNTLAVILLNTLVIFQSCASGSENTGYDTVAAILSGEATLDVNSFKWTREPKSGSNRKSIFAEPYSELLLRTSKVVPQGLPGDLRTCFR